MKDWLTILGIVGAGFLLVVAIWVLTAVIVLNDACGRHGEGWRYYQAHNACINGQGEVRSLP